MHENDKNTVRSNLQKQLPHIGRLSNLLRETSSCFTFVCQIPGSYIVKGSLQAEGWGGGSIVVPCCLKSQNRSIEWSV